MVPGLEPESMCMARHMANPSELEFSLQLQSACSEGISGTIGRHQSNCVRSAWTQDGCQDAEERKLRRNAGAVVEADLGISVQGREHRLSARESGYYFDQTCLQTNT